MSFNLTIVTPKGLYRSVDVDSLTIRLSSGYRTFLSGHAPLIGSIELGDMHYVIDGKTTYFAIFSGAINVKKEGIRLLVSSIEEAKDIDVARANLSKERALNRLSQKDINIDVKRAELSLKRALVRLDIANRK